MVELFTPSARPVHLVKNFFDVPAKKRTYPMVAQEKHDGCYGFGIMDHYDYRIMSRTGKSEFKALKHLSDAMREEWLSHGGCSVVLIFEVMADNMSAAAIAGRCQDETNLFPEAYAVVHDCIPLNDFRAGYCGVPYEDRHGVARCIALRLGWKFAENTHISFEGGAVEFAESIIARGGEGAVFKQPQGTWEAGKKDYRMLKIKQELSYDLRVVGMVAGEGKYSNTLGTLTLKFRRFGKPDGELVDVNVSGMTDKQRHDWWNCKEQIIGQIVQVDAMRFTEFGMLREPRFKGIRYDKEQADIV